MSEISTYKLIKEKLQAIPNLRLKGSWFEKVSKRFLKEHDSADEYESIDLWSDFKLRGKEHDRGIDIVITTTSKEYIAVQCKFHQDSVSLNDIATFLSKLQSGVGEIGFKKGIIISTSNLSSNALEEIEQIRKSKGIDIVEISEEDFIYSQIDWVQKCIDTYNADLKRFNTHFREAFKSRTKGVKKADLYKHLNDREITTDKTKISWTDGLKNHLIKNKNLPTSSEERVRLALYRPFNKQWLYFDKNLNGRQSKLPKIFPDKDAQNVVINTGVGNGKDFSALVSDFISSRDLIVHNQAYPLYYYDDLGNRYNAISGYALNLFRKHYEDNSIAEEEIFYYIYAILHHKGYLEKYKNSLTKEDPRIALSEDFKELSILGKELAKLHLNYENGEMHASVEYKTLMNAEEKGYYDVETMTKKGDRIHYNNHIAITKISKKAFEYVVNGKSAIDWVIEHYKKTRDKDSLIENNPNDYKDGKYVFELLCRVIKLSEKSVDLIEKISIKRFE
ncbi:restriction endonuclease [Helicobacter pylori]|nr:restriction endonuclease [Helicobacter pylori]